MLTRTRGRDGTNVVAMLLGMVAVLVLCKVAIPGVFDFGRLMPAWWPKISWPWFVLVGCAVTCFFGVLLSHPASAALKARANTLLRTRNIVDRREPAVLPSLAGRSTKNRFW